MNTIKDIKKKYFRIMVQKWTALSKRDFKNKVEAYKFIENNYPSTEKLRGNCYYCELFDIANFCKNCPLNINGLTCKNETHPYNNWLYNTTKENAKIVLDLIIKTSPFK